MEQHRHRQQHRQYNFAMIFCLSYKHLPEMINMLLAANPTRTSNGGNELFISKQPVSFQKAIQQVHM